MKRWIVPSLLLACTGTASFGQVVGVEGPAKDLNGRNEVSAAFHMAFEKTQYESSYYDDAKAFTFGLSLSAVHYLNNLVGIGASFGYAGVVSDVDIGGDERTYLYRAWSLAPELKLSIPATDTMRPFLRAQPKFRLYSQEIVDESDPEFDNDFGWLVALGGDVFLNRNVALSGELRYDRQERTDYATDTTIGFFLGMAIYQ